MTQAYTIDRKSAAKYLKVSVRTIDRYLKKGVLSSMKRDRHVYILQDDIVNEMKKKDFDIPSVLDPKIKNISKQADTRIAELVSPPSTTEEKYEDYENKLNQRSFVRNTDNIQARQNYHESYDQPIIQQPQIVAQSSKLEDRVADSLDFYKNLYEVTKADLDDKVQQLNKVTFRLGQLESQVTTMIPLMEFKKQEKLLTETTNRYQTALNKERMQARQTEMTLMKQIEDKERDLHQYSQTIKDINHKLYLEEKNKHVFAILTFLLLTALPIVWLALK